MIIRKLGILILKIDLRNLGEALTSLETRTDALERTGAENGRLRFELARILSQAVSISIASLRLPESNHKMQFEYCILWVALTVLPRLEIDADGSLCCQISNLRCCCSRTAVCLLCQRLRCHFRKLRRTCDHIELLQTSYHHPVLKTAHPALSASSLNVCS